MDAGISLVLFLIAVISFGLIYFRVRDAWSDLSGYFFPPRSSSVSDDPTPEITSSRPDRPADTRTDTSTVSDNAAAPYPYLTERAIVVWLAGLKTADSWRYSANKIYALVGGHRNDVMAWVRSVRGDEPPPADGEITTPYAGRRTKAAYYPDTPDLEYQPPEVLR